jgi:hypothetical protein
VTSAVGRRSLSLRASLITFVLVAAATVAFAVLVLLVLDPRTQAFWGARWSDLVLTVRGLFGSR